MLAVKKFSVPLHIMLFSISALILLFVGLSILLIMMFKTTTEDDINEFVSRTTEVYAAGVDSKLGNYLTGTEAVGLNKMLRDQMWNASVSEMDMVTLGTQMQRNVDSITYSFYKSGDIYSHRIYSYLPTDGSYFFNLSRAEEFSWYSMMRATGKQMVQWYNYSNITKSTHLNIAKTISQYGVVKSSSLMEDCYQTISINLNSLLMPPVGMFSENFAQIYLFDNNMGEMIYSNDAKNEEAVTDYYDTLMANTPDGLVASKAYAFVSKDKKLNVTICKLSQVDLCVAMIFPRTEIMSNSVFMRNIFLWFFGVPVFLLLLFMLLFYKVYSSRLERIVKNIDTFDEKSEVMPTPLTGNDELARIDRHLTRLLVRIKVLFRENYLEKMGRISARLEALTICINPHFLYNTLNTISAMACMDGADDTVSMIDSLSAMFRYSSSVGDKLVFLRYEVENICEYLSIQQTRYQGKLVTKIDIPEHFMDISVPKLTLQPIVENCFKHGFRGGITGESKVKEISIRGEIFDDMFHLYVTDNGSGIAEDEVLKLKKILAQSDISEVGDGEKIGLRNVNNRIKLICGEKYGIDVESVEGVYTQIELKFPL